MFLIESQFEPQGSLFGLPSLIRTCGRDYRGPGMVFTRAEMDAAITAGFEPVVLEPTIGSIPLGAPFRRARDPCDAVVFLQTGPDEFVGYSLLGRAIGTGTARLPAPEP